HRVLELRVVEEPGEVLGVTLRQLDGEARGKTAYRARTSAARGAAGGLDVRGGRTEADHADVGEDGLADDFGRPGRGRRARVEHGDARRRNDREVVTERDVARHALLLAGRDRHGHVAAGQREVGGSSAGRYKADVLGEHVG